MANPLENTSGKAKTAYATLWLMLPFPLLSAASHLWMVTQMYSDGGVYLNPIIDNVEWQQKIAIAKVVVLLITGISFVTWMQAAYKNLHMLQQQELSHSPGLAVGGWFIPLFNLFIPPRILSEIWKFTPVTLNDKLRSREKEEYEASPIGWWWLFYLLGSIGVGMGYFLASLRGWGVDELPHEGGIIGVVGNIFELISLFIILHIVKECSRREKALYERVQKQLDSGELEFGTEEEAEVVTEKE